MIRTPLRPLARILSARQKGENPDVIERENLRQDVSSEQLYRIVGGLRPKIPDHTPRPVVDIIESCWAHEPSSRPQAWQLVATLRRATQELAPDLLAHL